MPGTCWVPGCRSNYESVVKQGYARVSVFSFPKEPDRRQAWMTNINRTDFSPTKHSRVCIKHFEEKYILRESSAVRDDGSVLTLKRSRPSLSTEAVPTIFENLPTIIHQRSRLSEGRKTRKKKNKGEMKVYEESHYEVGETEEIEKQEEMEGADNYPQSMTSSAAVAFEDAFSQVQIQQETSNNKKRNGNKSLRKVARKRGRPRKEVHPILVHQPKVDLRKFRRHFEAGRSFSKKEKRGRGRPRKYPLAVQFKPEMFKDDQAGVNEDSPVAKRGRGRPRKHPISEKTNSYKTDGTPIKFEGALSCCALACTNTSDTSVLHPFPENPSLRQVWVNKIDRLDWSPDVDSAICDVHFDEDMWVTRMSGGDRMLKKDAVPSLFLHGEAIKSWVTMDTSGNVLLENHLQGNSGGNYEQDNMSEDIDPDLYVKREALEPEIDMVEGSEDVLSQEPDSTAEEGFETIYCDSTYTDQDGEILPEAGNPFDQESHNSNSFSEGSGSEQNLKIQEDEVTCLDDNAEELQKKKRKDDSSNIFVISKPHTLKIKPKRRRNSDQLTREFECKACGRRLSRKKNLEIHMLKLHPNLDFSTIEEDKLDGKENQNILKTHLLGKKQPPPLAPLLPSCLLSSPPPMGLPSLSPITAPTLMATPIVTSTMVTSPGSKENGGEMKKQFLLLLPQAPPTTNISSLTAEQTLLPKINLGDYFINLNQVPTEKRDALKAKIKELVEAVSAKDLDPNRIIIAYDRT